jgi:hypothetical protein
MPQWQMLDHGERRRFERLKHQRKLDCQAYISAQTRLGLRPLAWMMSCLGCGEQANAYHHPDYRQPDNVVPLCVRCHVTTHKLNPPSWEWLPEYLSARELIEADKPEPRSEVRARAVLKRIVSGELQID